MLNLKIISTFKGLIQIKINQELECNKKYELINRKIKKKMEAHLEAFI